jgi:ADP-L-glycero-D-manno-heptose 6-epimerase
MIILTGGAGFIGSVVLKRLNAEGYTDIYVVDSLDESEKWKNLTGKVFTDYFDKKDFLPKLPSFNPKDCEAIIHLGACTSTTETDADYLMSNNYEYSKTLASWCFEHNIRFIYASSAATYGNGDLGFSDDTAILDTLKPMNLYGYSKHIFDQWLLHQGLDQKCAGLKFFNVFGPNEYHKGSMASLIYKAYHQIKERHSVNLFKSYHPDYKDGESLRDFIYVNDCADVILWLLKNPEANGIFNLGRGEAVTWNSIVTSVFFAMDMKPKIHYIDMPDEIRPNYQYYTKAEMGKLRAIGYEKPFTDITDAVHDYVREYLSKENPYL